MGKGKNILITLPPGTVTELDRRARRYGVSRRSIISAMVVRLTHGDSVPPPSGTSPADTGGDDDVQGMFAALADSEAPDYGERTKRRFNKPQR